MANGRARGQPVVKVYVEGGGSERGGDLATECRRAFGAVFHNATGTNFKVVACGGRGSAYDAFRVALSRSEPAVLLVDSEEPVTATDAWTHLAQRVGDGWDRLDGQAHLMVVCMESWLVADKAALAKHFGPGFKEDKIPKWPDIEQVEKRALFAALKTATKESRKGEYAKGRDSFKVLEHIDPAKLTGHHAQALFTCLRGGTDK